MSQNQLVLRHLKRGSITPIQALNHYGCFRLAAVIYGLRDQGHKIRTQEVTNKEGNRYARYSLDK
jgi:hypothetical protein